MIRIDKITCSGCGAPLDFSFRRSKVVCPYCGSVYQISEKKGSVALPDNAVGNNPLDWDIIRIEPKKTEISLLEQKGQKSVVKKYDISSAVDDMISFFSALSILREEPYEINLVNELDVVEKYSEDKGRTYKEPSHIYSYNTFGKLAAGIFPDITKPRSHGVEASSELYNSARRHEENILRRKQIEPALARHHFEISESIVRGNGIYNYSYTSNGFMGFGQKAIERTACREWVRQEAKLVMNPVNAAEYLGKTGRQTLEALKEKEYTRTVISEGLRYLLDRKELKLLFDSGKIGVGFIEHEKDHGIYRAKRSVGDPEWIFYRYGMKELTDTGLLNQLLAVVIAGIMELIPEDSQNDYYLKCYKTEACGYAPNDSICTEIDIGYALKKERIRRDWV